MPTRARKISLAPSTFHVEPAPANEALDTEDQPVLHSTSMREVTLPLSALPDGAFFRLELQDFEAPGSTKLVHRGWMWGQRLYGNDCRVRVRLAAGQHQVVFDAEGGNRREFESSGLAETNYPTTLDVVRVDPNASEEAQPTPFEGSDRSRAMTAAQEKALQKRYEFAMDAKAKATAEGDAGKVEVATKRVEGIVTEAEAAGVKLTYGQREPGTKPAAPALKTAAKPDDKKGVAALKAKAEPKAPREKKLPTTQDCLCGCGGETGGKFRPGHDARVKGWLTQVERGTYPGGFDALPDTLKPHVKMGGAAKTAGTENQTYRILQAPVKFPGRDDIKVV